MTGKDLAGNLYGTLKILEVFCEYTQSEDTAVLKPVIQYARQLADDLWYIYINDDKD